MSRRAGADVSARVDEAARKWRQGDVGTPGIIVHLATSGAALTSDAAEADGGEGGIVTVPIVTEAVAIVSQTCDVVRPCATRPFVKVSPVVRLEGGELANARARRMPRYAALPHYSDDAFADLDHTTTLEKTVLLGLDRVAECESPTTAGQFSAAVGRHGGRYAFPDVVEEVLDPVARRLRNRANKSSAEGRCVDRIQQIRATADPGWDADGYRITLEFVLPHGELDVLPHDEVDPAIPKWCDGKTASEVAARLEATSSADAATREFLWMTLVQRWCELAAPSPPILAIDAVVETEDSYTLWRFEQSEQLDFGHLTNSDDDEDDHDG